MVSLTRREGLGLGLGAAAALALPMAAGAQMRLNTRAIPSTGEQLPMIGLGSSATFASVARSEDVAALREVLTTLVGQGATLFDTAPSYGSSEQVAGRIANEAGLAPKLFWATKLNVARGGGPADPAAARAQLAQSFARIDKPVIDLIQLHNMGDPTVAVPTLREAQAAGKIRYMGITTTFPEQYGQLIQVMRSEPLDFIGVDYAIDNRDVEQTILPLAQERKIAVLAYAPFGRTRLFARVGQRPLPDWAAEFDAKTWAQFFLKWILGNPVITATTPATSQARNMLDNLGGGVGRLPDATMRARMASYIDALPQA